MLDESDGTRTHDLCVTGRRCNQSNYAQAFSNKASALSHFASNALRVPKVPQNAVRVQKSTKWRIRSRKPATVEGFCDC